MQRPNLGPTALEVGRQCPGTTRFAPQTSGLQAFEVTDRVLDPVVNFSDTSKVRREVC